MASAAASASTSGIGSSTVTFPKLCTVVTVRAAATASAWRTTQSGRTSTCLRPNSGTRPTPRETGFSGIAGPPPAGSCCGGNETSSSPGLAIRSKGRRDGHRPLLSTDGATMVVAPGLPEVIPDRPQPGRYSAEAIAQRREVAALLRTCRDQLATMCD